MISSVKRTSTFAAVDLRICWVRLLDAKTMSPQDDVARPHTLGRPKSGTRGIDWEEGVAERSVLRAQLSTRATWRLVASGSRKLPTYLPPGRGGLGAVKSYLPT